MVTPATAGHKFEGAPARWLNVVLGTWLFFSAFVWPHTDASRTNTWILGVLSVVFALRAVWRPVTRFLNALLSIWLFISAYALPHVSSGTAWNNAIVAIVMFLASLVPSEPWHRPYIHTVPRS
jgi:hypothetical protein